MVWAGFGAWRGCRRSWSCFGSAFAAVIRAKRTTCERPLLTHYLGTPASRLSPIRSTECRGYMSPAGRKLGPLPNPWCVWSKCGEPAIRGLGARWPSRFSAERFSDRIEGHAHAVAALNHGISALFTTRAPTCEGSPDLPAQTSGAFGLRQSKQTPATSLDAPAIRPRIHSPSA